MTRVLEPEETTPELSDSTVGLDARRLPPGATLTVRGAPALRTLRLPDDHAVDVVLDRAGDAAPLTLSGRVGALGGQLGPWTIPALPIPAGRRVARGGYVGPADAAPPGGVCVRICTGPGAVDAAFAGRRGQVRIAFGDPHVPAARLANDADPPSIVLVRGCVALHTLHIGPVALHTRVEDCPALRHVDGAGHEAALTDCGGGAQLDAIGRWRHLRLERCAARIVRTRATALHPCGRLTGLQSLAGAEVHRTDLPSTYGDAPPRERVLQLPGNARWQQEVLADALGDDAERRDHALADIGRWDLRGPEHVARLRAHVDAGVPIARVWEVRRRVLAGARSEPDAYLPGPSYFERTEVRWPADPRSWYDDLALVEAASGDAASGGKAAAVVATLTEHGGVHGVRLLLDAALARRAAGGPTDWLAARLREALCHEPDPDMLDILGWQQHRRQPLLRALVPRLLDGIAQIAADDGRRWVLRWLHHVDSGEVGLDAIDQLARAGDDDARRTLADVALHGGVWSQEDRAEALRRVLALAAPAA